MRLIVSAALCSAEARVYTPRMAKMSECALRCPLRIVLLGATLLAAPMAYAQYLPAGLEVRASAAEALGNRVLAETFRKRLAQLRQAPKSG